MRFLIDENIRKEVIDFLKSAEHDILIVSPGSRDEEIAQIAKDSGRIILSHDRHFADILMYNPREYPGIIRIKIHPPSPEDIIKALTGLLNKVSAEDINKKLVILEGDRFRIR